jgi:hypothetical protein
MIWTDPIVAEIRRVREAYAARFNYDLQAMYCDLKEQEKRSGRTTGSYAKDSAEPEPNEPPRPTGPDSEATDTGPSQTDGAGV